jgi:general secretion pathway protein A
VYLDHFGLREMPFSITPDPAYLYMSPRHQEALGHLLYGTGQYGGFVQLTGEVGTGKTLVVRTLLAQKIDGVDVAMVHNPRQSEHEFLASVCDELRVEYRASASLKELVDALNRALLQAHAAGRRTVLIIDEAQNLEPGVLEQIRLLTNLETHKEKLLRIMLIGQPELIELLARPDLRQLAQRITARYHLTPLSEPETREYIRHRLRVAGGDPGLFSAEAIHAVQQASRGVPRLINILCDRALIGAYGSHQSQVSGALVRQAAAESLPGDGIASARAHAPADRADRWLRIAERCLAAVAVVLLVALGVRGWHYLQPGAAEADAPVAAAPEADTAAAAEAATPTPAARLDDAEQPLATLFRQLVAEWDPALEIGRVSEACVTLKPLGYECHRERADWDALRRMDLPAILELERLGFRSHVLLRRLGAETASLLTPSGLLQLPLAELDAVWTGELLLIWPRPTEERRIDRSSRGRDVVWLRKRLAAIAGRSLSEPISGFFDAALEDSLRAYQTSAGLEADGVAGVQTLIALTRDEPGVLSLGEDDDVPAP